MPSVLRILDANANRAREALRVMEEAARFLLDHTPLTESLKQLRHDLAQALSPLQNLDAHRDTPGDVGTTVTTSTEHVRASAGDVALAAGKRLTEALRAIEEYAKTLGDRAAGIPQKIEQLRYRAYDLEQRLNRALATGRATQWRICLLLTESLCTHQTWQTVLTAALDAGVDCIQLREKLMEPAALLARAKLIVECVAGRAAVIVNDHPDIALLAGAHGVHLGQTDLPPHEVRKLVGGQLLIGVSTSSIEQAKAALENGADYCGVGPMFPTTTKHKDTIAGPAYLSEYLAWNRLPHLAIGGITPRNIHELTKVGVQGVAVSSAICCASDPAQAARQLIDALAPHKH